MQKLVCLCATGGEAFVTAAHLINLLPTPLLKHTSHFEKLFQKPSDFGMIKVFGCLCFPHTRPYQKYKLSIRSEPCVYLNLAPQYKGYKCLSRSGRVFITIHIIFDELSFSFKDYGAGFLLPHDTARSVPTLSAVPAIPVLPVHLDKSSIVPPVIASNKNCSHEVAVSPAATPTSATTPISVLHQNLLLHKNQNLH